MRVENKDRSEKVSARNPYLLIVGCTRSATTLLQRMLNSHPLHAVVNDSHFAIQVIRRMKGTIDRSLCWLKKVKAGLHDGASLDPTKYIEVRYEELVANSEDFLLKL